MANRKKRLKKGIESLDIQIKLHKLKQMTATKDKNIEIEDYYEKEINGLEQAKKTKEKILDKS